MRWLVIGSSLVTPSKFLLFGRKLLKMSGSLKRPINLWEISSWGQPSLMVLKKVKSVTLQESFLSWWFIVKQVKLQMIPTTWRESRNYAVDGAKLTSTNSKRNRPSNLTFRAVVPIKRWKSKRMMLEITDKVLLSCRSKCLELNRNLKSRSFRCKI